MIDGDWFDDVRITREVFHTPDGRIVGTEWTENRVWQGRDAGYRTSKTMTDSRVFFLREEATTWIDELRSRQQVFRAAEFEHSVLAPQVALAAREDGSWDGTWR